MQPAHQARELAEAAFRPCPAGGKNLRLKHDLGIGDIRQINRLAWRQLDGLAADAAGNRHLVLAERSTVAGTGDLYGMHAERD